MSASLHSPSFCGEAACSQRSNRKANCLKAQDLAPLVVQESIVAELHIFRLA